MSLKEANSLVRQDKLLEAKKIYNKIYKSSSPTIREQIEFNLKLINKKLLNNGNHKSFSVHLSFEEPTFVGIASIPSREYALLETVKSLVKQVDKIGIFLDGYSEIPDFLKDNKKILIKRSQDFDRKVGDAGKFFWVDEHKGFYFTCDDDLIYPNDYVARIKQKIISKREPVVVGWHGSLILCPFKNYYNKNSRRVFTFGSARPEDTPVHILGTGCVGFHTSSFNVNFCDFPTPNMADVYFAKLGQEQKVPFIVIKHEKEEIQEVPDTREVSIYQHSHSNKDTEHNTKTTQNEVVSSIDWNVNYLKNSLDILIVGRFLINEKGGIFKSSRLLVEGLTQLGHRVSTCCLSQIDEFDFSSKKFDFSIIYAPDPERPDFSNCIDKVQLMIRLGVVCAVNFSFNLNENRTRWIERKLTELNSPFSYPRCFFASFSNSTSALFSEDISSMIVPFPKTISLNLKGKERLRYSEREGIFLGDLAKLLDEKLTHGNLLPWIEELSKRLPHVNLYAIKHYHTDLDYPKNIKVIPYTKNIENVLGNYRLCINLTPGATFEMVPLEALLSGTPVLHRRMPQSLSEYLSPVSIEINSPKELGEVCQRIYENENIWNRLSKAGSGSYEFFRIENITAALDLSIRKCLNRSGN
ncbi:glycosyltransferase [Alteromonas pelagimontana]|uniref:Glycosyltransferase n=1 Tax=Alteromonas pelagimontana TaxID=1858656 RepID=A0A6M4MF82_9ALTE|nr:glycosyltransferase [Alteromonas pelagimontana]QJR81528.1 glycosyltransferase [Alteromonas pelagimontana]